MSRRNHSRSDDSVEDMLHNISKQERRISKQASEITYLENELADLGKEVKHWQSEHGKAKDEAHRHAGELSKLRRECKAQDDTVQRVRDQASKEVCAMQDKFRLEAKQREKRDKNTDLQIATLQQALATKEDEIRQLKESYADIKHHLDKERNEREQERSNTCHTPAAYSLPRQLTGKFAAEPYQSQLHRLKPAQSSMADSDRIAKLEKEISRMENVHGSQSENMHDSQSCEEYESTLFEQLAGALDAQKAAEAETDGLRHLAKMNKLLMKRREVDSERIVQLLSGQGEMVARAIRMEMSQLRFSGISGVATEPVAAQQPALQFSDMQVSATEPVAPRSDVLPTVVHHDVLCQSDMQAVSTAPDVSADTPASDKSSATSSPTDQSIQEPDALPNVAVTINITPSEKRNWTLLQYVQHAISTNSSININGPLHLVQQFVNEMEKTEKDHVDQASLAKRWEKVAGEYRAEVDAMKESIKQGKCGVSEHRDLASKLRAREHELEAKESQFQMHLLTQKPLVRGDEDKTKESQL
ncbi:Myosin-tail-1 multi-domain protein [Pyrenophora tritici-repentis]|uniref:Myosin-tail-1 multi-domain protein n=2 Tax=Pyrenophora tritici-repentis TaxID=45151 RepID=A0A2W1FFF1_9PLEO|nr:uncharacterized protein PTRG_03113 [Pyrenophora tritici-repentis Pt-1C-BFP]KAA8622801.1 hypothetical protein PtrV1_04107 [Pyrenophora tritici-repentis]EDU45636.1 predicted protein [Pyrenophora tritici-repentis Pt-1C-BFP]KAF7451785.1 hypothetical protein A1F99_035620 [Pyrenophora tritici-repentis]KAF7575091.1 Myosin-tail-1 multi-domain protein [Pyrenophora tritici-repentis]KAG9386144.1 hypothetical protein A1F94_002894 [Pyrenophora tritici-repentis]